MAYLGNQVRSVPFTLDVFSGDNSTTTFSLTRVPASTSSVAVYINGLYQTPTTAYTLNVSDIVFSTAPTSGTNNIQVLHLGESQTLTQVPDDGTVNSAKLISNIAITNLTANTIFKTPVFADNTARDAAITSPQSGMIAFVTADTQFQGYNGSGWIVLNN